MKCYHLYSTQPVFEECAWLQLSPTAWLMVHEDSRKCPPEPQAGHLLLQDPIPAAFATALASFGVTPTDTVARMALTMARSYPPFRP